MRNHYGHGFSLLELLITLAIASTLLCFSLPAWTNFQDYLHAKLITEKIISSLNYARLQAVLNNQTIQFKSIHNNYQNGWEILNKNKSLKIYLLNSPRIKITTEQFSRNNIITFQPDGTTEGSNGNFKVNNRYKITLNRGGRIYWEKIA